MAELNLKQGLEGMDVAAWLRRHPNFLKDFPDIADLLLIPREKGPAASLASYQIETLRERNRELGERLHQLIEIATENEQLAVQVHSYTLAMLRAADLVETLRVVVAGLHEDFHTDYVSLLLFHDGQGLPQEPWLHFVPGGASTLPVFKDFLQRGDPLCGRLAENKLSALFGPQATAVQSSALLKLGELGLLAIASKDPNHFHPGLSTLFLKLITEAVTAALGRYL